jgi:hypothetical protein
MNRCPSCGSTKTHQTFNNGDELACSDCKTVYNPVMEKVYTSYDYAKFCESVSTLISEKMSDANLGSSIREIIESYVNEPKEVSVLIEKLADIAEDLYNDYKMNRREKYDFGALLEGINRLSEFSELQMPQDVTTEPEVTSEVPDVSQTPDPMSMVNPSVDSPIEVGEHSALEKLKSAIDAVQCAISSLESAEAQENGAAELSAGETDLTGIPAEPNVPVSDDAGMAVEGLQVGSIETPPLPMGGDEVDPVSEIPPVVPGSEGSGHEQEEVGAIGDLKAGLEALKAAYDEYMGSEEKVHGDGSAAPEAGIGGPIKSPELADKLNALSGIGGLDNQTFLEKSKELMEQLTGAAKEDAQLVNQEWLNKDLQNSIDINTQEIGKGDGVVAEARDNEEQIPTQIIRKPVKENDVITGPGTEAGEITDQPGEVDMNGPIHTDDVVAGFSPETFFKENDHVIYENNSCVVLSSEGRHLTIRNQKNGHTIEVLAEDVEYANSEDVDIRGERMDESHNSLLSAWEKIEKSLNEAENLNAPKRNYDLRGKLFLEAEIATAPENNPVAVAPIHDPGASNVATIDSYEHKGKKVIRLTSPNGMEIEVVPAMSNKGPRFVLWVDKNVVNKPNGQDFWNLNDISQKLSGFGSQGISIQDIGKLTSKLEVLNHHMMNPKKESNVPYEGKFTNPEVEEEQAGFEFFEDEQSIAYINESIDSAMKDDNSNVEIPKGDKEEEKMEEKKEEEEVKPLEEGQYLQSGLSTRPAPIPFTQDPSLEGVPDYLSDEEKAGLSIQRTGSISGTGVDGGGEAMSESILEQFKKGDTVCIDRVMNVEWLVESVSANPDKIVVKNGKRTKVISPSTTFIEHADGVEVHKERQFENIEALKEAYMKMEISANPRALKANWCTYEESAAPEKVENTLPILEKNDMYSYIKMNELHKTDEVAALQQLCEKFGNPVSEIEKIMEDAHSSEANENVDSMYNFNATPYEENAIGLATTLESAWKEIEAKELEETAKLSDEQPGANGGGLGPKQIKFNL